MANELQNRVEAILFASGKGVTEEDLAEYCEVKVPKIKTALEALTKRYEGSDGSLEISKKENKWKLTVRGKYLNDVQRIVSETELPSPILKTLAVIAFKSPVLQSEVINIRGQGAYEHVRELVKDDFITKDEHGRSYILKITDKFYNYFDVQGDKEIREVFEQLQKNQTKLGDLEVVNATEGENTKDTEEQKQLSEEDQKKLGELKIVDASKEEPVIYRKEKSPEEKEKEDAFLKQIDEGITKLSSRIDTHKLPERQNKEEDEQTSEEEKEEQTNTTTEETQSNEDENEPSEKKEKSTPIDEIEAFVEKHEKKEKEENYL